LQPAHTKDRGPLRSFPLPAKELTIPKKTPLNSNPINQQSDSALDKIKRKQKRFHSKKVLICALSGNANFGHRKQENSNI